MFLAIYIPFFLVFLKSSLLSPAPENCANVFESFAGYALFGHIFDTSYVGDNTECAIKCMANVTCQSYNFETSGSIGNQQCELNNHSRISIPQDLKRRPGFDYYGSVRVLCGQNTCKAQADCKCHPGYKGPRCLTPRLGFIASNPGHSCKHIRDSGDSRGDGEYWIDPENNRNPLKAYCDMTTDGGGWLLVANFLMDSSTRPPGWTAETAYRGISNYHNNRMGITTSAMRQLRAHLIFTQLRFHCRKQQVRAFHVTTAANSTGEAVVQYFSGQTDVLPFSCGSFVRMQNDNSYLAEKCSRWGNDGSHYVGKWGHYNKKGERRLYDHSAFVANKYHWVIVDGKWKCDEEFDVTFSKGDFWKIFVR